MNTKTTTDYEIDPLAEFFPLPSDADMRELLEDIRRHGQREPAITRNGKIIDGRSRALACKKLGIRLRTQELPPDIDALDYVISANLKRRHLTAVQRAELGAELLPLFEKRAQDRKRALSGKRQTSKSTGSDASDDRGRARDQAAAATKANAKYVAGMARLKKEAPALHAEVLAGNKKISEAMAQLPPRRKSRKPGDNSPMCGKPVVILLDDQGEGIFETYYNPTRYPHTALYHLWDGIHFSRPGRCEYDELFVIRGSDFEEDAAFCLRTCLFLSLSVRGTMPKAAKKPNQEVKDWDEMLTMIDQMYPDTQKIVVSAATDLEVPKGWELKQIKSGH